MENTRQQPTGNGYTSQRGPAERYPRRLQTREGNEDGASLQQRSAPQARPAFSPAASPQISPQASEHSAAADPMRSPEKTVRITIPRQRRDSTSPPRSASPPSPIESERRHSRYPARPSPPVEPQQRRPLYQARPGMPVEHQQRRPPFQPRPIAPLASEPRRPQYQTRPIAPQINTNQRNVNRGPPTPQGTDLDGFVFPHIPRKNDDGNGRKRIAPSPTMQPPYPARRNPNHPLQQARPAKILSPLPSGQASKVPRTRGLASHESYGDFLDVVEQYETHTDSTSTSRSGSPLPDVNAEAVEEASVSKSVRPALRNVPSSGSVASQAKLLHPPKSEGMPVKTIAEISAAIAAGIGNAYQDVPGIVPLRQPQGNVRMPFDSTSPPISPSSFETARDPPRVSKFLSNPVSPRSPGRSINAPIPESRLRTDRSTMGGMSEKVPAERRPPPINIQLVKEAETRGSTTSLGDLILRATKLAANLERGKTASRFGLLDMYTEKKRESGVTDMLSSFPVPGETPTNLPGTRWPSVYPPDHLREDYVPRRKRKRKRRMCGLTMPTVVVLSITLFIVVIAAVVLPVLYLVVFPDQKHNSANLRSCSTSYPCQNQGISVISDDACGCICVKEYTGDHCQLTVSIDCTTTDLAGYSDVTIGSLVPTLLDTASTNFSIPLNNSALLSSFSASNVSCTIENALVTFNNPVASTKRDILVDFVEAEPEMAVARRAAAAAPFNPQTLQQPTLSQSLSQTFSIPSNGRMTTTAISQSTGRTAGKRQGASTVGTSNGIVFQASTSSTTTAAVATSSTSTSGLPPSATPAAGSSASAAGAASSATSNASSASSTAALSSLPSAPAVPQLTLDFAGIVTLFMLAQSNSLSVAVNAHQQMQTYLLGSNSNGTQQIGSGAFVYTANFGTLTLAYANGTSVNNAA